MQKATIEYSNEIRLLNELMIGRAQGYEEPDPTEYTWMVVESTPVPAVLKLVTAFRQSILQQVCKSKHSMALRATPADENGHPDAGLPPRYRDQISTTYSTSLSRPRARRSSGLIDLLIGAISHRR